jgi:hypothetical protein
MVKRAGTGKRQIDDQPFTLGSFHAVLRVDMCLVVVRLEKSAECLRRQPPIRIIDLRGYGPAALGGWSVEAPPETRRSPPQLVLLRPSAIPNALNAHPITARQPSSCVGEDPPLPAQHDDPGVPVVEKRHALTGWHP